MNASLPSFRLPLAAATLFCLSAQGCAGPDYTDLEAYYEHEPRTILVLPVQNESTDAEAARFFMATIAKPLIGRGYYVAPVEATAKILQAEGLSEAGDLWQVDPRQFARFLGVDAVLYITIESWDTTYLVIHSSVTVGMHYRLVDCRTGELLWENRSRYTKSSGSGGGGGIAGLVAATIDAAMTAAFTDYVPLAFEANRAALAALPAGHYHQGYAALRETIRQWRATHPKEKPAEKS